MDALRAWMESDLDVIMVATMDALRACRMGSECGVTNYELGIAYVMQQDILCPTQTVRESLMFSANLRLPRSFSAKEKCAMVDQMIMELGLAKCADTYIGDDLIRGISGGEKKRTCVAIELIVQPKLVFLDEPTTGLDSFAAPAICAWLCGVSRFRQRLLSGGESLEDDARFTVPIDLQLLVLPFCNTTIEEVEDFVDLVAHGQVEEVEQVLQRPQDPNLKPDSYFERPIWFAAVSDKVDVLRLLLEAGAEVGPRERPLLAAAEVGRVEVVRVLLEAGARHEANDPDDNEALCAASEHGHLEVVRLLLGAGFDKHVPSRSGKTPSELAAKKGHGEIVRLLLECELAIVDSKAQNVIQKLRDLAAKEGCNVLCTIHQPSSEVFHLFNKVMLLHAGRLFFFGMVQNLSRELAGSSSVFVSFFGADAPSPVPAPPARGRMCRPVSAPARLRKDPVMFSATYAGPWWPSCEHGSGFSASRRPCRSSWPFLHVGHLMQCRRLRRHSLEQSLATWLRSCQLHRAAKQKAKPSLTQEPGARVLHDRECEKGAETFDNNGCCGPVPKPGAHEIVVDMHSGEVLKMRYQGPDSDNSKVNVPATAPAPENAGQKSLSPVVAQRVGSRLNGCRPGF
eukprot:s903_g10.t1